MTFLCGFSSQRQMIIQDKLVKELNDAKNAVEEYVYDLRDKLCGIYEKYITGDVSAAFLHIFSHNCLADIVKPTIIKEMYPANVPLLYLLNINFILGINNRTVTG